MIDYIHGLTAIVAMVSLINFSSSIDMKKDQFTSEILSEVYKKIWLNHYHPLESCSQKIKML